MTSVRKAYKKMRRPSWGASRTKTIPRLRAESRSAVVQTARRAAQRELANTRTGGLLGIEEKFVDFANTGTFVAGIAAGEIDPAANISSLSVMAQGDGESQRDGRKVTLKSIYIKGYVYNTLKTDQTDALPERTVCVALVHDKQTNGAQLEAEHVYDDGATYKTLAHRNLQYSSRFNVLWKKIFVLRYNNFFTDGANTATLRGGRQKFVIYKKLNIPVTFSGTTADIANVQDNSLHLIGWGTTDVDYEYEARLRFVG